MGLLHKEQVVSWVAVCGKVVVFVKQAQRKQNNLNH